MADSAQPPEPPSSDSKHPSRSAEKKKAGWIQGTIERSTGLPDPSRNSASEERSLWSYAGIGIQLAGTVALFLVMGYFLDRQMGWTPWGMIGLTLVGIIGSL